MAVYTEKQGLESRTGKEQQEISRPFFLGICVLHSFHSVCILLIYLYYFSICIASLFFCVAVAVEWKETHESVNFSLFFVFVKCSRWFKVFLENIN